jgi:hypothetical protein
MFLLDCSREIIPYIVPRVYAGTINSIKEVEDKIRPHAYDIKFEAGTLFPPPVQERAAPHARRNLMSSTLESNKLQPKFYKIGIANL